MPTSLPHNGNSFSTACFASMGSDHVTHLRNLVNDRGERKSEKRNFQRRSLSAGESGVVGGKRKISYATSAEYPLKGIQSPAYIQSIPIRRSRLQISARIAQSLTSEQLPMLDLDRVFAPRVWVVCPPEVWVVRDRVRLEYRYVLWLGSLGG